jgi:uncharacterized membrane protein YbhN (UPF0104 family)
MFNRALKVTLALLIGGVFLWLAFRNVKLREVWYHIQTIDVAWLLPFAVVGFLSHVLRAERWRLLLEQDKEHLSRVTLIAGVLTGYLLNIVGPRLGEVARPVYVARQEGLNTSKLMGTIVLERVIDVATMLFIMFVVSIYLISDLTLLSQIFGEETISVLTEGVTLLTAAWIVAGTAFVAVVVILLIKLVRLAGNRIEGVGLWVEKVGNALRMFKDGILSARKVKHWWLFVTYTLLIWSCYTLMTYIPFWMFDMQETFNLGMLDALTITVISAVGIAIPSPGGIGTYHYFVKQSLLVLFAVPAITGLAYATVTHAAMVIMVSLFTPLVLAIDKFRLTKAGKRIL